MVPHLGRCPFVARNFSCAVLRIVCAAVLLLAAPSVGAAPPTDRIWFCPGPGTLDFVNLFERPEQWAHARQLVSVFKFYQQHTLMPADPIIGPNSYDAFVRAGAFQTLTRWGKKTAIEVGAVKEFYCTPDASGMNAAIANTAASVRNVQSAGGLVSYLAMDEPFVSGRSPVCGGPALEPTADRVATYVAGVHAAFPNIRIGLIEAYPFSSADAIQNMLGLLRARGATPAFLHMDVDLAALQAGRDDFARDIKRLQSFSAGLDVPFGVIIWGNNGDADALYASDAGRLLDSVADTFGNWNAMPDQLIIQSWASSSTGLRITPANLPESQLYTHTNLLWDIYRRLRGQSGGSSLGAATERR